MANTFFYKLLNNPFNDPVVTVEFRRDQRFFLFDIGEISIIPQRHLQKISHIFVSHMHIDHFVGFDTLLRAVLIKEQPIYVYGPKGIINAVNGKLSGYTWNLIKDYPLKIEVCEVTETSIITALFYAKDGFNQTIKEKLPFSEIIYSEPTFSIKAAIFDHQIPVLGYALIEDMQININKARLIERSFKPGSWLSELKINTNNLSHMIMIDGIDYSVNDLKDLTNITKGQKIVYITDIAPSKENIEKAVYLAMDADILFIEGYFLTQDSDHTGRKSHLTARAAGYIARMAGVKKFELIHISKKYLEMYNDVIDEAMKEFLS
jgi:ribonuclease Z